MTPFINSGRSDVGMWGARRGGTLNEAKTVSESLNANNAYVGLGRGRGAAVLNSRVRCESFQMPTDKLVIDVAANLEVP